MAEGFNKHFNSTTINGRANVAKVTYGSIVLLYLFYRFRRGSGKKAAADGQPGQANLPPKQNNQDDGCSCDKGPPPPQSGSEDPNCAVCRERAELAKKHREHQGCEDPPKPPPTESSTRPRRKCPCEEPHRRTEAAVKTEAQRRGYQSTSAASDYSGKPNMEDVQPLSPAAELVGQVQQAVYRVLRNVMGAVMGSAAVPTAIEAETDENPEAASAGGPAQLEPAAEPKDQQWTPRSVHAEHLDEENEAAEFEDGEQLPPFERTATTSTSTDSSMKTAEVRDTQNRHRCFSDEFAWDMYYEDFEE